MTPSASQPTRSEINSGATAQDFVFRQVDQHEITEQEAGEVGDAIPADGDGAEANDDGVDLGVLDDGEGKDHGGVIDNQSIASSRGAISDRESDIKIHAKLVRMRPLRMASTSFSRLYLIQ